MKDLNTIAVDLAKSVFQVCVVDANGEVILNREFRRQQFIRWLAKQKASRFVVEACGGAHYWAKRAKQFGHTAELISAKFVKSFRQGQKTDKNDALAIAVASRQPNRKPIQIKSDEQLALQACERIRDHIQSNKLATSNLIRAAFTEFGITIRQGESHLKAAVPELLEDAENGLPHELRQEIHQAYEYWLRLCKQLQEVTKRCQTRVKNNPICKRLMQLEGVGEVNAVWLYITLGVYGEAFKNGREASACIGMTPQQHSSGGKTIMLGIGKKRGNKDLRSKLIQGALSVAKVVQKRPPRNTKEQWLSELIERRGLRRAAVALANKTIRTAWAMLHYDKAYQAPAPLAA